MLPLPQISQKDYAQLVDEMIQKIPTMTKEWTDFNAHDPGITMLQNFAWLSEMQQYYGEAIGQEHIRKYLKLLGYTPKKAIPAQGVVAAYDVEEEMLLPKGTRLQAGQIDYELDRNERLLANKLVKIYRDEQLEDISELMHLEDSSYERIFSEQEGSCFYIGFEKPLDLKSGLELYIKIAEDDKWRINCDKLDFVLSECSWELYTDTGWQTINEVKDETAHFLKDGYIFLKDNLTSRQIELKEGYVPGHYLRCTLVKNEYDLMPCVRGIGINQMRVSQKKSMLVSLYLSGNGEVKQSYRLEHALAQEGKVNVCVKEEEGLWRCLKEEQDYSLSKKEDGFSYLCFDASTGEFIPEEGKQNIRVICYEDDFYDKTLVGYFKNAAYQRFELDKQEDFYESIAMDAVYEEQGKVFYESYEQVEDLQSCGPRAKAYTLREGEVHFGDRHHGTFPINKKAELRLTELVLTKGFKGNIKENKITSFADEKLQESKIRLTNNVYIGGGKDEESIKESIISFRLWLAKKQRAISASDYEEIVKKIPGLLIKRVKAVGERQLNKAADGSNKVYLIVEPYGEEERTKLPPIYKRVIEQTLEKYRLLTVETVVVSPTYVPIDVYACIYRKIGCDEKKIYNIIKEAVEEESCNAFGKSIIRGKLFGLLNSLEGVERIEYLSLEPASRNGKKTLSGDILIQPNELTYLRNYHVELR